MTVIDPQMILSQNIQDNFSWQFLSLWCDIFCSDSVSQRRSSRSGNLTHWLTDWLTDSLPPKEICSAYLNRLVSMWPLSMSSSLYLIGQGCEVSSNEMLSWTCSARYECRLLFFIFTHLYYFLAPTLFHRGGALDLVMSLTHWLTQKFALPIWIN